MLPLTEEVNVQITPLSREEFAKEAATAASAVGHADTAAVLSQELGYDIPTNRVSVTLDKDTELYVAQYKGPRLPEGAVQLPEGAKFVYLKVTI